MHCPAAVNSHIVPAKCNIASRVKLSVFIFYKNLIKFLSLF